VTLTWAASTRANGGAVDGYRIKRYTTPGLVLQAPTLSACFGTIAAITCTENNVPSGDWKYSVTPVFATNWTGAESTMSATATVNSPPVLTASGGTTAHTENVPVFIDSGITVTDTDTATMASGTVTVGAGYTAGQDVLAFTNQNGITGSYSAPTLTLTGSATKANWQTALGSITYNNTSDAPNTGNRTINFVVNDGLANSNTAAKTVSVTAVNDGPANSVPGAQSITATGAKVFSTGNGNLISISDPDAASGAVQVQLVATTGTITLSGITGLSFTAGDGTDDLSATFTGTITAINTALAGLGFTPTAAGAASLQIITNDQGNTGSGGALSDNDTIAITVSASALAGHLYGWGDNTTGNLGLGNTTGGKTSPTIVGAATWTDVATGNSVTSGDANSGHTCGVQSDGTLWCWGRNVFGQLARGNTTDSSSPVKIGVATDWATAAAAAYTTCVIKTTGGMWCAGDGQFGELGNGSTTSSQTLVQVSGGVLTWKQVSATNTQVCATRTDGTLWCWGDAADYKLGDNSLTQQNSPVQLAGTGWDTVTTGRRHGCAVKTAGTLWCWGLNATGQLGVGSTTTAQVPTQVGTLSTWDSVAAGAEFTCGIMTDGTLWCWGDNSTYQLGQGNTTQHTSPIQVGTATWTKVAAGEDYACGTRNDRTVWCWGNNTNGQLGLGNTTTATTPTQLAGVTGRVFAGRYGTTATFVIG
jgi:alpha-tubulin suppressor-like RCC1 family protein